MATSPPSRPSPPTACSTSPTARRQNHCLLRPNAKGDITGTENVAWTADQGGAYLSTPVDYQGNIYLVSFNGHIRCFDAVAGLKAALAISGETLSVHTATQLVAVTA